MRRRLLASLGSLVLLMALASPASAIVYGERDTEGLYSNVGAVLYPFEGELFQGCSGTLIAPTVVLTAAHCVLGWEDDLFVSFASPWSADSAILVEEENIHPHPSAFCCGSNDWFDIAVLILDEDPGVDPAPLPTEDQLGQMSTQELKSTVFTAVGYGTLRETNRQAWQGILEPDGYRNYADQTANSLTKAWLTLSMNQATGDGGTCYGDSGGPHFLPDGTVVSITVTGDRWCKATDKTYRVDTASSLGFLAPFLGGG